MLDKIKARLTMLGYQLKEHDDMVINYYRAIAEEELKSETNQNVLPTTLTPTLIEMAAGRFLRHKKALNELGEGFNFPAMVKTIAEGDTSITYAISSSMTPEEQFDKVIERMVTPSPFVIVKHRRMTW